MPKENGWYSVHSIGANMNDSHNSCWLGYIYKQAWLRDYDWYLQPIEPVEAEKKEKYPVIAIEDIDVETVKRWFQLFMGFKDDSKMKTDIRAMARASHLNKHLNWEEVEAEKQTYTPNPPIGSTTDFVVNIEAEKEEKEELCNCSDGGDYLDGYYDTHCNRCKKHLR